ncbi:MAG: PhzF family phenazine biosynthesis protein [Actinomycetota bacterium]|nr:PhzF family phenazine biosynthesis protein [Actinomycetota bacterium]
MPELHVLRVFTGPDGSHGNPLGVFLDGAAVPEEDQRQAVAADLGYSETVFVDDRATGAIQIFTPATELRFAGHPTVGTAWLLGQAGTPVEALRPPAGEVTVRYDGELTAVAARPEWAPAFNHYELGSPEEVDSLAGPPEADEIGAAWAWEDEASGRVRTRVFATAYGIFEDEATGAAAVRLCALLGREVELRQGRGSLIHARPLGDGRIEIGGRVVLDEVRDYRAGA